MRKLVFVLFLIVVLSLASCGGDESPSGNGKSAPGGDVAAGKELFDGGVQPGCNTCHSLDAGVALVGPPLAGIGAEAGSRVPGQSAEDYLREAILEPNNHVVDGFNANLMPSTYKADLSDQEASDLVAYMLTLK